MKTKLWVLISLVFIITVCEAQTEVELTELFKTTQEIKVDAERTYFLDPNIFGQGRVESTGEMPALLHLSFLFVSIGLMIVSAKLFSKKGYNLASLVIALLAVIALAMFAVFISFSLVAIITGFLFSFFVTTFMNRHDKQNYRNFVNAYSVIVIMTISFLVYLVA
jgi:hypothetical protein